MHVDDIIADFFGPQTITQSLVVLIKSNNVEKDAMMSVLSICLNSPLQCALGTEGLYPFQNLTYTLVYPYKYMTKQQLVTVQRIYDELCRDETRMAWMCMNLDYVSCAIDMPVRFAIPDVVLYGVIQILEQRHRELGFESLDVAQNVVIKRLFSLTSLTRVHLLSARDLNARQAA